ncbi:MAG TPA: SDR family NAD(P)-dependent oxidoreductase, partial [Rhizobiaceae bacterium]|nr:SDR family NAD(P)-dependent oxidoreductase [Rhizobiaceae bacterium]
MDNELFCVTGMTALVTGASSGLGRHMAETLATHGANVVAVARRSGDFFRLAKPQPVGRGRLLLLECDVTHRDEVLDVFNEAERE